MWMKKGRDLLDLALETYDGMEVCKVIRAFVLEKICEICN